MSLTVVGEEIFPIFFRQLSLHVVNEILHIKSSGTEKTLLTRAGTGNSRERPFLGFLWQLCPDLVRRDPIR